MPKSIFLAGAGGAIGRRLLPLLVNAGHRVTGTTRRKDRADDILALGATPAVVDVFDAAALNDAVQAAVPDVVIHQLTDLTLLADPEQLQEALARNARLRIEGTANLVAAALTAGAKRIIAQSISFVYAPGNQPYTETAALNQSSDPRWSRTVEAVTALEREVTQTPGIDGIVLRYGHFYGPGTGRERADAPPKGAVHVDAAAHAALLSVDRGRPGIYNIAEDDGDVDIGKARAELGFDPAFRIS